VKVESRSKVESSQFQYGVGSRKSNKSRVLSESRE